MTQLEDRLREELPSLADTFVGASESAPHRDDTTKDGGTPMSPVAQRRLRNTRARWLVAGAAAAVTLVVAAAALATRDGDTPVAIDASDRGATPTDFGTWNEMAEAPISARAYPVSAWTGEEALFWAGSSLDRGFAYTDAVAYDPDAGVWRTTSVPGWGHPGLRGTTFDGELFAVAKGGGARFDFETGQWTSLPEVDDSMFFTAVVAGEDAVWGLGPTLGDLEGQPDLAIVRYDADGDVWRPAPLFPGTEDTASVIDSIRDIDVPVVWTGDDIVVWDRETGLAFDPDEQTWTVLPELAPPSGGEIASSRAVPDADGLTVVAEIVDDGVTTTGIAHLSQGQWSWKAVGIPPVDLDTSTVAAADSWIVLLPAGNPPITVHMRSGAWDEHPDAPTHGAQGPGTVWTGTQLIVWGGLHQDTTSSSAGTHMTWTPPTSD